MISATKTKSRARQAHLVLQLLKRYYPDAHCALEHKNAFELLIATILSAQCTDERVNSVTPTLFKQYSTPELLAKGSIQNIEKLIRSTGFYKNKAKNIRGTSQVLIKKFQGKIPLTIPELIELPGVGRKTANVVLGNAFQIPSGVVVDTHVGRLSRRLGWTKSLNPELVEQELQTLFSQDEWIAISHYLIFHGRQVCKARKPQCEKCFLSELCPKVGV